MKYSTQRGDKGIRNFAKRISPNLNVIARLVFDLAYNYVIVQYVSHYLTGN